MADEQNNEQIADVTNLIGLCEKVDPLPLLQRITINQQVSFTFEFLLHRYIRNDNHISRMYGAYICLVQADAKYYGNYIDELLNYVSEDDINELLIYIRSGIIPYHIWYQKLGEDLKNYDMYNKTSVPGMLAVYLLKTLRCSLICFSRTVKYLKEECNLSDELKEVVQMVETRYLETPIELQEGYANIYSSEKEEDRIKFKNNEISLFTEVLEDQLKFPLDMRLVEGVTNLEDDNVEKYFAPMWIEMPSMSSMSNTAVSSVGAESTPVPATPETLGSMGIYAIDLLGYGDEEPLVIYDGDNEDEDDSELDEIAVEEQPVQATSNVCYVVKKIAKNGSTRVMSENWFNTEREANEFKRDMEETNPEITRFFEFKVEVGHRKG